MLKQVNEDLEDQDGVYVRNCLDGSLFNLWCLQAHTKTHERLIRDLLFEDDAALVAHTEQALQCITSCFANAAQLFCLEVSLKKTEVLYQPAPGKYTTRLTLLSAKPRRNKCSSFLTWVV